MGHVVEDLTPCRFIIEVADGKLMAHNHQRHHPIRLGGGRKGEGRDERAEDGGDGSRKKKERAAQRRGRRDKETRARKGPSVTRCAGQAVTA